MVSKTPISDTLGGLRTKGTAYSYRSGILLFFDVIYGKTRRSDKATSEEFQKYETLAARYLREKRDHAGDMVTFVRYMQEAKTPSKTIKIKIQGVREFFGKHDIELSEKEKREIKKVMPRRVHRETRYEFMTMEKIQAVLPHLDIRLQALALCLLSSGARISELLSAEIPDLNLNTSPFSIYLRETKTGDSRTVYITPEAGEALKKWFTVRGEYLESAGKRSRALKVYKDVHKDNRIFPFERTRVYRSWDRALIKSGLYSKDDKTNRNTLSIHRLRAFFRETTAPIIGVDAAELILGHIDGYDNTYRGMSEEKKAQQYLLCEDALTIASTKRVQRDLKAQGEKMTELEHEREKLRSIVQEQGERLQQLETQAATLEATKDRAHSDPLYADLLAKVERMAGELAEIREKK